MLRTALMTVVAAGTLVGVATPASAAPGDPTISITGLDNGNLQPGSQATLTFTIKASGLAAGNSYNIAVTSSLAPDVTLKHGGSNCGGSCTYLVTIAPGDSKDDSVTLVAAQNPTGVPAGQQKGGSIRIDVTDPDTSKTVTKSQAITLQGPAQQAPTSVNQISGTVKDVSTGQPSGRSPLRRRRPAAAGSPRSSSRSAGCWYCWASRRSCSSWYAGAVMMAKTPTSLTRTRRAVGRRRYRRAGATTGARRMPRRWYAAAGTASRRWRDAARCRTRRP